MFLTNSQFTSPDQRWKTLQIHRDSWFCLTFNPRAISFGDRNGKTVWEIDALFVEGLPADAKIVCMFYDDASYIVRVRLWSHEWPVIGYGEPIEDISSKVQIRRRQFVGTQIEEAATYEELEERMAKRMVEQDKRMICHATHHVDSPASSPLCHANDQGNWTTCRSLVTCIDCKGLLEKRDATLAGAIPVPEEFSEILTKHAISGDPIVGASIPISACVHWGVRGRPTLCQTITYMDELLSIDRSKVTCALCIEKLKSQT